MKEAEIFETETIVLGWGLIFIAVLKKLFPNGEWAPLELPTLLFGEIGDRSVEPEWFRFGGPIGEAGRGIACDEPVSSMTDEGSEAALGDAIRYTGRLGEPIYLSIDLGA